MLFKSIVCASLAVSIFAAPAHQHHQHEKKDVVVKTVVVTVGNGAVATAVTPVVVPTAAASVPAANAPASQAAPSVGTSTQSSGSPAPPSSGGSFNAASKGVTYSPYSNDGGCKSSDQIASEIKQLSGFEVIRLYGVDCNQVEAVMAAKSSSQKVFAGIFDVANIASGIETLASAVKANGGWDHIHTVSVGNELVNSGQANAGQIKQYVNTARSALTSAGYSGPVVSVDTFIAVINNPELCDCSDYMAVNAHAFFDGQIAANDAGKWVLQQIQRVSTACGNSKSVMITESGWPSRGDSNGVAVPSVENQQAAVSSIGSTCGGDVILFTAFNDLWKADGPFNAEKYWGMFSN
jgi:exo-beta-1,3-glucanase (GH17 family)